jgi:predicted nucleotidyltransferase
MVNPTQSKAVTDRYYRYWPPNIPLAAICRFADEVAKRYDPEKVVLFGSHAYGTPHEYSDVDLLVVMPTRDELTQAARITLAFEPVFPLDLIVRTPQHLERGLAEGDSFSREIITKGIMLYEKGNVDMGPQSGRRLARRRTRSSRRRPG